MSTTFEANSEPIPGYRLIERLGHGGYGEVWKAEAPGGLLKAIKLVYGTLDSSEDSPAEEENQVERELKGLERIKMIRHPYILSTERFEAVEGRLIIVMELADRDLQDRWKECHKQGLDGIPRDELLKYLSEAAEALDLMSDEHEVQHLDIKPANLFLVGKHLKVADFGLAKVLEREQAKLTSGMTPIYAAPETFTGVVNRYTDQYSLGIVYQELLTGERPFPGPSSRHLMLQHLTKKPILKSLPEHDRPIVGRALSKVPNDRYPSCTEFIEALLNAECGMRNAELGKERPAAPSDVDDRSEMLSTASAEPIKQQKPDFESPASSLQPQASIGASSTPVAPPPASPAVDSIIGIDLGTSNSVVAVLEGKDVKVLTNQEGSRLTPSVVAISPEEDRIVGAPAKRQATTNPKNTVFSIKRFMGCRREEISLEEGRVPFQITGQPSELVKVRIGDKEYTAPEISAILLRKLKEAAEDYLGQEVRRAILTVPAYFNDSQRQATKDAGAIAGLEVLRIINEPTAASLAYGVNQNKNQKIVVFDLGGGTFDITILRIRDGIFDVLSTNGDTHLGGDDFDAALVDHFAAEFEKEHGFDPRKDPMALGRLQEIAEKTKQELSSQSQINVNLPFLAADDSGPKHLNLSINRTTFEQLTEHLIQRCKPPCLQALADAKMSPADVDEVVLVGGSTRMQHVREMVRELFGKEPHKGTNPDEAVAIGAAIQGKMLEGGFEDLLLLDVTPLSLGLEAAKGLMSKIIERNTTVPTIVRKVFNTAKDNQSEVGLHVVQGEREFARDNRTLGRFWLEGLRPAPAGELQIEVTFEIDANGILNVSAKDLETGNEHALKVESSSGLSTEEIQRMSKDAERSAAEDKKNRELLDARNQADAAIHEAEKDLAAMPKSVSQLAKEPISKQIDTVREMNKGEDVANITNAIWQLQRKVSELKLESKKRTQTSESK